MANNVNFPENPLHGDKFMSPNTFAVYLYNDIKKSWYFDPEQASGGRVTISTTIPVNPIGNDLWIDAKDYSLYAYDGDRDAWIGITNHGITASVYIGDVPPPYRQIGALWFDSNTGDLKVSYQDPDNETPVWVALTGNGLNQSLASNFTDVEDLLEAIQTQLDDLDNKNYFEL